MGTEASHGLFPSEEFFSTRVVWISKFPAAGSAFTAVTNPHLAANCGTTIQGKAEMQKDWILPQNQAGTAFYRQYIQVIPFFLSQFSPVI